jgi:hypothetical protein
MWCQNCVYTDGKKVNFERVRKVVRGHQDPLRDKHDYGCRRWVLLRDWVTVSIRPTLIPLIQFDVAPLSPQKFSGHWRR